MSWGAYITNSLMNKQDANGHVYNNVLTEAAIYGLNGAEWAKAGISLSAAEVQDLVKFFEKKTGEVTAVNMGGK